MLPGASSAALLTLLVAGLARLAYEDAYRQVGTTLDAVGLSNARLLTLAAATALALIGLALLTLLPMAFLRDLLRGRGLDLRADVAGLALSVTLAAFLAAGLRYLQFAVVTLAAAVALVVLLLGPLLLRLAAAFNEAPRRRPTSGPTSPSPALTRIYLQANVIAAALLALLAGLALQQAPATGRALADDGPASARRSLGLLDLAPTSVCVRSLTGQALNGLAPPQLLLGTNAGVHILLAPGPGARAQVVPAAAVRLEGRAAARANGLPDCS